MLCLGKVRWWERGWWQVDKCDTKVFFVLTKKEHRIVPQFEEGPGWKSVCVHDEEKSAIRQNVDYCRRLGKCRRTKKIWNKGGKTFLDWIKRESVCVGITPLYPSEKSVQFGVCMFLQQTPTMLSFDVSFTNEKVRIKLGYPERRVLIMTF
mmetsp:Transcript_10102/g.11563  ORF Transcript_10102/g.11563 Transcript_10102/m.11563 type:complete len:151 (-) Transcript_10102:77-529(-)